MFNNVTVLVRKPRLAVSERDLEDADMAFGDMDETLRLALARVKRMRERCYKRVSAEKRGVVAALLKRFKRGR